MTLPLVTDGHLPPKWVGYSADREVGKGEGGVD